jgi:riboflavin kinase / FMN adenylyltransferase
VIVDWIDTIDRGRGTPGSTKIDAEIDRRGGTPGPPSDRGTPGPPSTDDRASDQTSYLATIGAFDGVHRGHQHLISRMVERARASSMRSLVVTFEPLPGEILHAGGPPSRLTDVDERLRLLASMGVDRTAVLRFSRELSELPAAGFLTALLARYKIAELWAGEDFAFGHNREGDVTFLRRAAREKGFELRVISRIEDVPSSGSPSDDGTRLSSSQIRRYIASGDIRAAARLLGHHPSVGGIVVRGAGRGRKLGYPTANLETAPNLVIPKIGIYAGRARLEQRCLGAAISIGYDPTFGANPLTVEAYILDFDEDIYGQTLTLELVDRLREEERFDSADALIYQIGRDVEATRAVLDRENEAALPASEEAG